MPATAEINSQEKQDGAHKLRKDDKKIDKTFDIVLKQENRRSLFTTRVIEENKKPAEPLIVQQVEVELPDESSRNSHHLKPVGYTASAAA